MSDSKQIAQLRIQYEDLHTKFQGLIDVIAHVTTWEEVLQLKGYINASFGEKSDDTPEH